MAEYNIASANRWWLQFLNYAIVPHAAQSGRIGGFNRGAAFGYVDETLATFNLSSLAGMTVQAVTMTVVFSGWDGVRAVEKTMCVDKQDRKRSGLWSNPPKYDDFPANDVPWSTDLSCVAVPASATPTVVVPSTAAFIQEVQDQINGVPNYWGAGQNKTWQDGFLLHMPTDYFGYYNDIGSITLNITTGAAPGPNPHKRHSLDLGYSDLSVS